MEKPSSLYPVFRYPYRVIYADTDAGGVVYYANYLAMFERARTCYIEEFELSIAELARQNCLFFVRHAELRYHSPALLGDQLILETTLTALSKATLDFSYRVLREHEGNETELVDGTTKLVCCALKDGQPAPCRIPDWVWKRFTDG